jgi:hypothetical protein
MIVSEGLLCTGIVFAWCWVCRFNEQRFVLLPVPCFACPPRLDTWLNANATLHPQSICAPNVSHLNYSLLYSQAHAHARIHTYAHTHTHTHTHHISTHTHARTNAHVHTCTHARNQYQPKRPAWGPPVSKRQMVFPFNAGQVIVNDHPLPAPVLVELRRKWQGGKRLMVQPAHS